MHRLKRDPAKLDANEGEKGKRCRVLGLLRWWHRSRLSFPGNWPPQSQLNEAAEKGARVASLPEVFRGGVIPSPNLTPSSP